MPRHQVAHLGAVWFSGTEPKRAMKEVVALTKAKCQLVSQEPDSGYRQFTCYPTWPEAISCLQPLQSHMRHIINNLYVRNKASRWM